MRFPLLVVFLILAHSPIKSLHAQTTLPPWQEGMMDIHHVSTGRGNATFFVFPDGTTLLLDAGEISDTHPRTRSTRNSVLRPNTSRSASDWLVDYIKQFHPNRTDPELDYAIITHFHDDHFGEWDETRSLSPTKAYRLTGITTVGDQIPIKNMLDRGWNYPVDLKSKAFKSQNQHDEYHIVQTLEEYWKFIEYQQKNRGLLYDTIQPGAFHQIRLQKNQAKYPNWQLCNVASGGNVWTGYSEGDYSSIFKNGAYPGENPLSVCLKITYGDFDYFAGGDISGINELGETDLYSLESYVAPVVGPVDVATLNHHGNRDSQNPFYVRTLRPRVWIEQVWSSDHPGEEVLRRITSNKLYPGERDVFTTDMLSSNELVIGDKIKQAYRNEHGHVVLRVFDHGSRYMIYILNDFSTNREVLSTYGPYLCR